MRSKIVKYNSQAIVKKASVVLLENHCQGASSDGGRRPALSWLHDRKILDLTLSTNPNIHDLQVVPGMSDHDAIVFNAIF